MPRIFDNIEQSLLPTLLKTLELSTNADFCTGYFNLRGWKEIDGIVDQWSGGEGNQCRLLVGMQSLPQDDLSDFFSRSRDQEQLDNRTAHQLKRKLAEEFRVQLTYGCPSNVDEKGLRKLADQIKAKKIAVKLFLKHQLHAKLYLSFRKDDANPIIGYLGSSNLTLSGLSKNGELNVEILDTDTNKKLAKWFNDRWNDKFCVDISAEILEIIEESWAREKPIPPYHIYIKMAYHLSHEARSGLTEFRIPSEFGQSLFDYQVAAVKIAAHHLNNRNGVLIGDVVGLGKTMMATALAKIFQEDFDTDTLIICPKNLVKMWKDYVEKYRLLAKVISITKVQNVLPDLKRYRVVLIDESQNLRNREGKRYRVIQEYIHTNGSKCILLSATPYNKTYVDLSNQLRLFVSEQEDLGIRPEKLLRDVGEAVFIQKHQCPVNSLAAFEKSQHADDWRELMRLYMVRRTGSFIQENYATVDPKNGRKYLTFEDGTRSYFPTRLPKTMKFKIDESKPDDQYAQFYSTNVVKAINLLSLPRYGLANYVLDKPDRSLSPSEEEVLKDLSRGGKRLMGFCRTGLFKRLESSGEAFRQSIERHILRNYIFLYAIKMGQPLPIGTQDTRLLDSEIEDEDLVVEDEKVELLNNDADEESLHEIDLLTHEGFEQRSEVVFHQYTTKYKNRFKWLDSKLFSSTLRADLQDDASSLLKVLQRCGEWKPESDAKLDALYQLVEHQHPDKKIIVFSQFADTVRYLEAQLKARKVTQLAGVTGGDNDPTEFAWRFSPESNGKQISPDSELRVLIATDVLSEGQNLQDAAIVVNFDLPWAIIRLIQRAGRVDRIGQKSDEILCYSFLPAAGVENLIGLRSRVRKRLKENAEVVGTDEAFFEDEREREDLVDLYNEKAGILDDASDSEVDLASYAYQIWKNAIDKDSSLKETIPKLPPVVYSTCSHQATKHQPHGVLVYSRTSQNYDALTWVDKDNNRVTDSQFKILKAAKCHPDTPALARQECHHDLVKKAYDLIATDERSVGGQLGQPSSARHRTYERLKSFVNTLSSSNIDMQQLDKVIEDIYKFPLQQSASDALFRQLRAGIDNYNLAEMVIKMNAESKLCLVKEEKQLTNPLIVCSLGLAEATN